MSSGSNDQRFIGTTALKECENNFWELLADIGYENAYYKITCKSTFKTDGASIPKILWSLVGSPLEDDLLMPAIIHDGLYTLMLLSREKCDKLLLEMLKYNGVSDIRADLIYSAVRAFGGSHWSKDTSASASLISIELK